MNGGKLGIVLSVVLGFVVKMPLSSLTVAEAAPPIKVGVVAEWDFVGGQGVKRGAEMAIREINSAGGLLGRKVEGVFYDDKCDPGEAKNATERLLYNDKVDVVCGFWRSDLAIVCQPLIMETKKVFLIGGAASPILTVDRIKKDYNTYKYTFTGASHAFQNVLGITQGINASLKLGLGRIALMVEKAAWADPVYDYILKKYGEKMVYSTRFSTAATDFSVELAQQIPRWFHPDVEP